MPLMNSSTLVVRDPITQQVKGSFVFSSPVMQVESRANQQKWLDSLAVLPSGSPLPPGAKVTIHTRSEPRPRRSRAACAAARKAEADARDVKIVCGWLMDAVVKRAELNAAFGIEDVVHAPRYGRVDVARSLIEQNAEVDWADEEEVERLLKEAAPAAEIEAFSHKADALGSDWDSVV